MLGEKAKEEGEGEGMTTVVIAQRRVVVVAVELCFFKLFVVVVWVVAVCVDVVVDRGDVLVRRRERRWRWMMKA